MSERIEVEGETIEFADESIATRRSDRFDELPDDMPRWMVATIVTIDRISIWTGKIIGWLTLPLIVSMVYEIVMRYAFTAPTAWAYDLSRMFYGAMFVLGAGYALQKGVHIRSDFLNRDWSVKTQGLVDSALYLFLFLPAMVVFFYVSADWAWEAIDNGERGMDTAWMPLLGPIKACLPVGVLFLVLQGISELLKSWYAATRGRWPQH
ncbi:MAG: TRAP transporter small permease subunit [Burkholderiaceae bacterium]